MTTQPPAPPPPAGRFPIAPNVSGSPWLTQPTPAPEPEPSEEPTS